MSAFFGEEEFLNGGLEEAVCDAAFSEGLGSLGITSAQRVSAENKQWNAINSMRSGGGFVNQSGISRPQFSVGAGGSDKVKGEDGQWRQATGGEQDQMKAGTFDAKKTAQGRYQSQSGHVGADTKQARMDRDTMQQAAAGGQAAMRPGFNVPTFKGSGNSSFGRQQGPSEGSVAGSSIARKGESMEQYGNRMKREAQQRGVRGLGDLEVNIPWQLFAVAAAAYFFLRKK